MNRNDRRGLESLCMSIIGWRSLENVHTIGCDVTLWAGTFIVMEYGEVMGGIKRRTLKWGKWSSGEGYFQHIQGDLRFVWYPGPVAAYRSQCFGPRLNRHDGCVFKLFFNSWRVSS